jgi:hypothetical protein
MRRLVEIDGCIFDEAELQQSHGYESLDPVGREAFVNHLHLTGSGRADAAAEVIAGWAGDMRSHWPDHRFRIYRVVEPDEVTVRFHAVRPDLADWCESGQEGVEVISVGPGELAGHT